jgi:hypothetical protein
MPWQESSVFEERLRFVVADNDLWCRHFCLLPAFQPSARIDTLIPFSRRFGYTDLRFRIREPFCFHGQASGVR